MRAVISLGLLLLLIFATSLKASNEIDRPVGPVVYAGSDGTFELYWFWPRLHRQRPGNVDSLPDDHGCVGTGARKYGVLTKFRVNPPVMVDSVLTFISGNDPFPDLPGDQYSPIMLSLKRRQSVDSFEDYWVQAAGLDPGAPSGGRIVGSQVGLSFSAEFELWAGFEWLKSHPTAPQVGICREALMPEQYIYQITGSAYLLQESQDGFMVGLDLLHWSKPANGGSDRGSGQDSISFSILYAEDTVDFFDTSVELDILGPDSLYSRIDIQDSGYVCIVASDGISPAASEYIFLNKDRMPSLEVMPPSITGKFGDGGGDSHSIYLTNVGSEELCAKLVYDSSVMVLSESTVCLAQAEQVEIAITVSGGVITDSTIASDLIIETSGETYPLLYHMTLRPTDPTAVPEVRTGHSPDFRVTPGFPNPFNSEVEFELDPGGAHELKFQVFNLLGRIVYEKSLKLPGKAVIRWNGLDREGGQLPSGLYFFRFVAGEHSAVRKAVLIK
jgi:hypothetical protein